MECHRTVSTLDAALSTLRGFDAFSRKPSRLRDVDPRALVLATALFAAAVVSMGKYELAALAPFCLYPVALTALGGAPAGFLLTRVCAALPLAAVFAAANLFLDTRPVSSLGGLAITGGMLSFASILARFVLTAWAALALAAALGMPRVCRGLRGLGAPRAFVVQLDMLHRFAWVLAEEATRMNRARQLRSFGGRGLGFAVYGQLVGQLLLRSLERAGRVHQAMLCRGFTGEMPMDALARPGLGDAAFVAGWGAAFWIMWRYDPAGLLGGWLMGVI